MFVLLLPLLQGIAACFTIFGFMNTPRVTDTVVTYGLSGDNAPNLAMLANSYGSILMGVLTWCLSYALKHKLGFNSQLYTAVVDSLKSPNDKLNSARVVLSGIDVYEKQLCDLTNVDDIAQVKYMRDCVVAKFVQSASQSLTTPAST